MPVSARVSRVLAVVEMVKDNQPKSLADVARARRDAAPLLAASVGRYATTVHDAFTQQLGLTVDQFDRLVWQWYDWGDDELRRLLLTHVAAGHQWDDRSAIEAFFDALHPAAGPREAAELLTELAKGGQGQHLSHKARTVVKGYAISLATDVLECDDWHVENVSRCQAYDLRCTKPSGEELRVVVKGTTSDASAVLLTPLEVRHARSGSSRMGLFVACGLRYSELPDGSITLDEESGWDFRLINPWDVQNEDLTPLGFEYRIPPSAL